MLKHYARGFGCANCPTGKITLKCVEKLWRWRIKCWMTPIGKNRVIIIRAEPMSRTAHGVLRLPLLMHGKAGETDWLHQFPPGFSHTQYWAHIRFRTTFADMRLTRVPIN